MNPIHEQNRRAWDRRVREGDWYIDTARAEDFRNPLAVVDPCGWLDGDVRGKRLLCLAAGGGRHGVLFASAGARVTVVDLSPAMLALDRQLARDRHLEVTVLEGSMDNLGMLGEATFEIVIQPVSSCYVPGVALVYREVARVLAPGGVYVAQHKQPVNLQADASPIPGGYLIREPYYRTDPLPPAAPGLWHREAGTIEFLHRWDQLLGDLCKNGFVIEDVAEPRHGQAEAAPGSFAHRSWLIPPYIKIKARRTTKAAQPERARLWTP